jgi:hypothetical protein
MMFAKPTIFPPPSGFDRHHHQRHTIIRWSIALLSITLHFDRLGDNDGFAFRFHDIL